MDTALVHTDIVIKEPFQVIVSAMEDIPCITNLLVQRIFGL
jgi:hypothetical protein